MRSARSTWSVATAARSSSWSCPRPAARERVTPPSASATRSGVGRSLSAACSCGSRCRPESRACPPTATPRPRSCARLTMRSTPPKPAAVIGGGWHRTRSSRNLVRVAAMSQRVTKAVIPAAGLGTRFLPATKATPKEMLPVVDKPAIQYVVEECARAGLDDVLVVIGRNKSSLEDHFDRAYELEHKLEGDDGKRELLDRVRDSTELATMHFVRQKDPRGLGHAVACAAEHVGREPFAVLLGDDLIDERDALLSRMLDVQARRGGCVLGLLEVPRESISLYGCAVAAPTAEEDVVRVTGLVEKPTVEEAPSNLAVIGRYVLTPEIFDTLAETGPGSGGEIQITDAIASLTGDVPGGPVHGVVFRGRRYDTGDKADYLRSIVQVACDREDLGPDFRAWLADFVAERLPLGDPAQPLRP